MSFSVLPIMYPTRGTARWPLRGACIDLCLQRYSKHRRWRSHENRRQAGHHSGYLRQGQGGLPFCREGSPHIGVVQERARLCRKGGRSVVYPVGAAWARRAGGMVSAERKGTSPNPPVL